MKRGKNGVWYLNDSEMNFLSYLAGHAADDLKSRGLDLLVKKADEMSLKIYRILKMAGYYGGVK